MQNTGSADRINSSSQQRQHLSSNATVNIIICNTRPTRYQHTLNVTISNKPPKTSALFQRDEQQEKKKNGKLIKTQTVPVPNDAYCLLHSEVEM